MTDEAGGEATDVADAEAAERSTDRTVDVDSVVTYLQWGALVALGLLALVAGVGVYTSVSSIIDLWVAPRYRPMARAAFNLAVLCLAVAGMFALLARVRR